MTPSERSVILPNGIRLAYAEQGEPSGNPILLLHGLTDSWRSFQTLLPHLPEAMHAIALTLRGHGDSDRPAEGYAPADLAADVAAFMAVLRLPPAVIVGHSMGSVVAERLAIDHPEQTLGLVLLGAFARLSDHAGLRELWDGVAADLTDPIDPQIARAFQQSTLCRPIAPDYFETVVQESLKVPSRVWQAALAGMMNGDFSAELRRIQAPTLVLWGDQDSFVFRDEQDALTAAIRGARLVVHEGSGHALHWEDPARVAADLTRFAERLADRAAIAG